MGAVYRAYDRDRTIEVALKSLLKTDARALYRFKREFRSLADVAHPNLIDLYELYTVGDEWFFTMELIEGIPFISHVRPFLEPMLGRGEENPIAGDKTVTDTGETKVTDAWERPPTGRDRIVRGTVDPGRLDHALYQLVDGVSALHRAGKLHRDLKPSNVLVDTSGRLVLLDFGLTGDVARLDQERTHDALAVGTPIYMSPEQAADVPLTGASDWYSVGVMLYEALTGRRPFEGAGEQIYVAKQLQDPKAPGEIAAGVPPHLGELCMRLLARDPRQRPADDQIFEMLGRRPSLATRQMSTVAGTAPFVGREAELDGLRRAMEDSRLGGSIAVFVRGRSGMGKTALVRRFLDEVAGTGRPVILEGRCYERESVPYKALDAVVDALTRHLLGMADDELERIMPRDVMALARLFPVLRRVPAIAEPARRTFEPPDPHELRRRAFAALRYLLKQLAVRRPVILYIDDLQWGDVDSASFLADLIYHPAPPAVLLIISYRIEDEAASPLVRALRRERPASAGGEVREINVLALPRETASDLVRAVVGNTEATLSDGLFASSGGSPLFLVELSRMSALDREAGGSGALSLEDVLRHRIAALEPEARRILEMCAVIGRPAAPELVIRAAGLRGEAGELSLLRKEHLIRSRAADDGISLIEPYHDRVRETVMGELDDDTLQAMHRELALAYERDGFADPAILVQHWWIAGNMDRVAGYAEQAAVAAREALAFNRAAELYRLALQHGERPDDDTRELNEQLGHALSNAGQLREAADAFAAAADGAPRAQSLELGRHEMEQRLRSGDLEGGLAKAREVLGSVDLRMPAVGRRAVASILGQRLLLRLRGFDFRERDPTEIPPRELRRLEVCWSTASGFTFVNPFVGRALQMRFLRLALSAGEPAHIALAMALEAGYRGLAGTRTRARVEEMRARALTIAERLDNKRIEGLIEGSAGVSSFLAGQWRESLDRLRRGEQLMRDHATAVRWEIDICQFFTAASLIYAGDLIELGRLLPLFLREAEERGDIYGARGLRCWRSNMLWLVLDRPDDAESYLGPETIEGGYHLQHYYEMQSRVRIHLYRGDGAAAHALVTRHGRLLKRSMLLRIQSVRIETASLRARAALAAGADSLAEAESCGARLEREDAVWSQALGALVRAGARAARGDDEGAVVGLWAAIDGFARAEMAMHEACARWRLGALMDGDEGRRLSQEAADWMSAQNVGDPEALVRLLAPGFAD